MFTIILIQIDSEHPVGDVYKRKAPVNAAAVPAIIHLFIYISFRSFNQIAADLFK